MCRRAKFNDNSQWDALISIDTTDVNVRVTRKWRQVVLSQQVDDLIASILV